MDKAFFAYVTHSRADTVSVIDVAAGSVVAEIPVGGGAKGIAGTPDGKRVYVAIRSDAVAVLDATTNLVEAAVTIPHPIAIAVAPDGGRAYVAGLDGLATKLSVLDTAANEVTATIPIGVIDGSRIPSMGVALTPNGERAYVTSGGDTLVVVDAATNAVVATIPVLPLSQREGVIGMAVTPDGRQAFIPSGQGVGVFETAANTLLTTISSGEPDALAVSPDGNEVYVVHAGRINIINAFTKMRIGQIPAGVGGSSRAIAFAPDGKRAYVAGLAGAVAVIDTVAKQVGGAIAVQDGAAGIAVISVPR